MNAGDPVPDALRFPVVAATVTIGLVAAAVGGLVDREAASPGVFREASLALVVAAMGALTSRAGRFWSFAAVLGASVGLVLVAGRGGSGGTTPGLSLAALARCLLVELAAAAVPFAVLAVLVVKRRFPPDRIVYVTIAMSGALGAEAMLDLSCVARAAPGHLVAAHLGGVLIAGMIGFLLGAPITARARSVEAAQKSHDAV